jgi:hypothetical protein
MLALGVVIVMTVNELKSLAVLFAVALDYSFHRCYLAQIMVQSPLGRAVTQSL